jgi:hypothetical protein
MTGVPAELALSHLFYRARLRERFVGDPATFLAQNAATLRLSGRDLHVLATVDVPGLDMEGKRRIIGLMEELDAALPLAARALKLGCGSGTLFATVTAFADAFDLDRGALRSLAGRFAEFVRTASEDEGVRVPAIYGDLFELEFNVRLLLERRKRANGEDCAASFAVSDAATRLRRNPFALVTTVRSNAGDVLMRRTERLVECGATRLAVSAANGEMWARALTADEATAFRLADGRTTLSDVAWYLRDPGAVFDVARRLQDDALVTVDG